MEDAFAEPVREIVDDLGLLEGEQLTIAAMRRDETGGMLLGLVAMGLMGLMGLMGPMSRIGPIFRAHTTSQ